MVCFPILRLIATLRAGVLSRLFRELNEPLPKAKEGKEMRWIIYDGDVDAVWVENMNSVSDSVWFPSISQLEFWEDGVSTRPHRRDAVDVAVRASTRLVNVQRQFRDGVVPTQVMDDNRLLTLPNGERIRLQPHCCMICETFDLQYASPATISRCGMVWADPKNLGCRLGAENELELFKIAVALDALVMITRESTRLASARRQCRDCICATQVPALLRAVAAEAVRRRRGHTR